MMLSEASPKMTLAITHRAKEEIHAKNINRTFNAGFFNFLKNVVFIISFFKIMIQIYDIFTGKKNLTHIFLSLAKYINNHEIPGPT